MKNFFLVMVLWFTAFVAQAGSTNFTYYVNDALGSPVVAMNQAGDVIWRKSYAPYGKASGKDQDNRVGYTGHVEDQNGLVYAGARYYDPTLGMFTSDDPLRFDEKNPMSFNRYAYANNNPYKYVDPDGRDAVSIVFQDYEINTGINNITVTYKHAGVLAIDNATGLTKYHEFGRYGPNSKGIIGEKFLKEDGNIRNIPVSNAVIGEDGKPTEDSLKKIYAELSKATGQNKSVETVYHEGTDFNAMQAFIDGVANNKERDNYSLFGNNCFDFKNNVIRAGNKKEDK